MKSVVVSWLLVALVGANSGCDVPPTEDAQDQQDPAAAESLPLRNIGVGGPGGGTISLPPEEPDLPGQKPRKPTVAVVVERTASQLTVAWTDRSSYESGFYVYRAPDSSGPWTRIASLPASPGLDAPMRFVDGGLSRDTSYWYQIGAFNYYGESRSIQGNGITMDGRGSVGRVQIRFRTSTASDANTDDNVHVALNYYQENHGTFLDYGRNDFERGDDFTYDLQSDDVSDLSQISEIYVWKTGDDGWCFDDMTLLVNGKAIYEEHASPCHWLDDEGGARKYHVVSRAMLRAHPLWQAYTATIPRASLPRLDLAQRIEGYVGNLIHRANGSEGLSWAGSARDQGFFVAVTKKDATAIHVVFTLGVNRSVLIPGNELETTISFDLRFTGICRTATTPPQVLMQSENADASVNFSTLSHIETLGIINFFRGSIASDVVAAFPSIERVISIDNSVACAMPSVASDGSVDFELSFRRAPGGGLGTIGGIGGVATRN